MSTFREPTAIVTVRSPWACQVTCKYFISQREIDFDVITTHRRFGCECRRSMSLAQERINEELISQHVHSIWFGEKCSLVHMLYMFGLLKLGLPVDPEFELPWDNREVVRGMKPQKSGVEAGEATDRNWDDDFEIVRSGKHFVVDGMLLHSEIS
ncbi:hypothetical protein GGR50DRAFT_697760 [Xylaria sp. CBS 124048]|nr:hypothetical protein GGR50DRAFT_697760 [Xylaria sp. CBS 124048]